MNSANTTLHTVNKSGLQSGILASCLRIATRGDAILLIEDGVYAVAGCAVGSRLLEEKNSDITLFALREDLQARGLESSVPAQVKLIDYAEFVALTCSHSKTISWF